MHVVGELRDPKMVEEILQGLKKCEIEATSQFIQEHELYLITVKDDSKAEEAQDYFRVKMGFKKPAEIDPQWVKIKKIPKGDYTFTMVMISVALYVLSFTQMGELLFSSLFIGKVDSSLFLEVSKGQVWRLITPIFLHMSFLHILFNMLWFKDLGYLIEFNFGKKFLLQFVLGTGLISNLGQYFVSGPQFGGMSGVLYGMLGFIWVYKQLHREFEYAIPRFDLGMMIGWFFLCLTGVLGPIANTAHGAGLVAGMIWAVFYRLRLEKGWINYFLLAVFFLIFTLFVEGYKLDGRYYLLLWTK